MQHNKPGGGALSAGMRLAAVMLALLVMLGCGGRPPDETPLGSVTLPPSPSPVELPPPSPAPPGAEVVTPTPSFTPVPPATVAPSATPWPGAVAVWGQWGGSRFRNWQSAVAGPESAPSLLWASELPGSIAAEPLVLGDGSLRVITVGGTLLALSPEGAEQWRFEAGGEPLAPALGREGSTYLGTRSGVQAQVYALSPAGEPQWQVTVEYGLAEPPLVDADGNLYLVTFLGEVLSLSGGGLERWRWKPETATIGHLVMDASGVLYAGPILSDQVFGRATHLWALDPQTGAELWWMQDGGLAAVDASGQPYFIGSGLFRVQVQAGYPTRQDIAQEEARTLDYVRVRPAGGSFDPEADAQPVIFEMTSDASSNHFALLVQLPKEGSPQPSEVLQLVGYDVAAEQIVWQRDTEIPAAGVQPFLPTPTDRRGFTAPVVGPGERIYLGDGSTLYVYGP